MSNLGYIISPRVSDEGTWSASDTVGGSSAEYLATSDPGATWESVSTTPYLIHDAGTATSFDRLVMGYIGAPYGDDGIRIRASNTLSDLTAAPDFDQLWNMWPLTAVPGDGIVPADLSAYAKIHRVFEVPEITVRYRRIDFLYTGTVSMARCFFGTRLQPPKPVQMGWDLVGDEPDVSVVSIGGNRSVRPRGTTRGVRVTWGRVEKLQALGSIYPVLLERGRSKDFLVVVDPEQVEEIAAIDAHPMAHTFLGTAAESHSMKNTFYNNFEWNLVMRELAPVDMA